MSSKKIYLLLLYIIALPSLKAQEGKTQIDEFVSVNLPGKIVTTDTIIDGIQTIQKHSVLGNAVFFITKMKIGSQTTMPYDEESLYEVYRGGANGFIYGLRRRNFTILDSARVEIGNFKAYHIKAQADGKQTAESKLIVLGDWMYMINYINVVDFNEKDKDELLNSIKISSNSPEQYSATSPNEEVAYSVLKLFGAGLVLAGIIFIRRKVQSIEQNKNNMA